jgi:hypothetical protein
MLKLLVPPHRKLQASESLPVLVFIFRLSPRYDCSPSLQKVLVSPHDALHSGERLLEPGLYLEAVIPGNLSFSSTRAADIAT